MPLAGPIRRHLATSLLTVAVLAPPNTDLADCGNIGDRRAAAVAKLIEAVRTYEACVSSGDQRNDCSQEIDALDAAHDEFADIVADAKTCR